MWSSPILLSLSTIFALIGFSMILLAGFSDQWLEYHVNRTQVSEHKAQLESTKYSRPNTDLLFYSRNQGLTHICFPDLVPSDIGSYSKFGSVCITNPDYLPSASQFQRYTGAQVQRLWMLRSMLGLFLAGLTVTMMALCVGIVGCYRRSAKLVGWTAMLFLLSVLFLIFAMLLWHYVNYMERKMLEVYPFYPDWPKLLKQSTRITFGWSYIVCWIGIGFLAFTALLLWLSRRAIQDEEEGLYEQKHAQYFQHYGPQSDNKALVPFGTLPAYAGYGTYGGAAGYGYGYPAPYFGHYASPYALYAGGGYYAPV